MDIMAWIDDFNALHKSAKSTRIAFYGAAAAWADETRAPKKEELIADAGKAQAAFYDHFGQNVTRAVVDMDRRLVDAVVDEAKTWYFQPWLDGWQLQVERLRLGPGKRLETLVQTTARWAQEYSVLATQDDCTLPHTIGHAISRCHLRTKAGKQSQEQLDTAATAIVRDAVRFALKDRGPGSETGALGAAHPAITALGIDEFGLEEQAWAVMGAIADLMRMWRVSREDLSPFMQFVLTTAIEELREEQAHRSLSTEPDPRSDAPVDPNNGEEQTKESTT